MHVSGHPAQDELTRMYQLVRPRIAVPVHGEARHLMAQARLAEECQVPQSIVTRNGEVVSSRPARPRSSARCRSAGSSPTAKRCSTPGRGAQDRQRMTFNGAALATIVVDTTGAAGAAAGDGAGPGRHRRIATEELGEPRRRRRWTSCRPREWRDDAAVREAARLAVRRALQGRTASGR